MERKAAEFSPSGRAPLVIGELSFVPADACDLDERCVEKARVDLHETEEARDMCLAELRQRLEGDPSVKYRTDDIYLLRFLRVRKFNCERAYQTIRDLYDVREKHPEAFTLPSNLESLLNLGFIDCLPYTDQYGRVIFKVDYAKWNPTEVSFGEILSLMIAVSDVGTVSPRSQIHGVVGVWDMGGMSLKHLAQFVYPGRIWLFFKILQGCYPWRIKMIIGVNCDRPARMLYKVFRPFVKTKILERVLLLGSDMSELHDHVHPSVLPKQFGGHLEDIQCRNSRLVLDNLPYLDYERSFGKRKGTVDLQTTS